MQVGNFGCRLAEITQVAHAASLFGSPPAKDTPRHQTLQRISQFLAQHQLACAATPSVDNHITTASYYLPTVEEFARTQLDRQAAGLRTNADRETATGVTHLVEGHAEALQRALQEPLESLCSHSTICNIHRLLLNSPTGPAGEFRTTRVRAGQTLFAPPESINREMDQLWSSVIQLRNYYFNPNAPNSDLTNTYYAIALAATVMYAICDIHPFVDGNGRTSRIYVNALLRQFLQIPFTITIAATPQQRQEYVDGIRKAQRQLEDWGDVPPSSGAVMEPLIYMIMDRIGQAVVGLQTLLNERARTASDEEEARIARRVRELAAQGQCIICLDSNPNIATLCCGQAVHLNCIAEWLANGTSCVSCRKPLPRLSVANRERQPESDLNPYDNVRIAYEEMQDAVQRAIRLQNRLDGIQDDSTEVTIVDDVLPLPPQCPHCQNRAATDCGNQMCGRCCVQFGHSACERHGTAQDEDTTTSVDNYEPPPPPPQRESCTTCNNVAANDCPNRMCRNCCVNLGRYGCERHRGTQTEDETEESIEEDTTETMQPTQQFNTVSCTECRRNLAALNCSNTMCGRCCIITGLAHRCNRHGG